MIDKELVEKIASLLDPSPTNSYARTMTIKDATKVLFGLDLTDLNKIRGELELKTDPFDLTPYINHIDYQI